MTESSNDCFTSSSEATERIERFNILAAEIGKKAERTVGSDAELLEGWKTVIPQSQWGEVSLTTPISGFESKFNQAIQGGVVDSFLDSTDSSSLYVARSDLQSHKEGSQAQLIAAHYTPGFLEETGKKLDEFEKKFGEQDVNNLIRAIYEQRIRNTKEHIRMAMKLGTPEFTVLQKDPAYWMHQIDLVALKEQGTVVLKYEQQARELLEKAKSSEQNPLTMQIALDSWQFNEEEKRDLGYEDIKTLDRLSSAQGKKLFEILARRVSKDIQVIDSTRSSINANAMNNELEYPTTRILFPDEVRYLPGHEFIHLIRGINGYKQKVGVCGEGEENYLETEEGLAVLTEMILGQPFGHVRQQEFATRYLTVAMALKAEQIDGVWKAQYTTQEIYNELLNLGVDASTAAKTVWRVVRGTSLKRQTAELVIGEDDDQFTVHVAEAFEKDTIYFRGMMRLFEWARDMMPVPANMKRALTVETQEFSPETLKRIGATGIEGYTAMKNNYGKLEERGREFLLTLLQYMLVGKMTFESIMDPNSPWHGSFTRSADDGIVNIRSLLWGDK